MLDCDVTCRFSDFAICSHLSNRSEFTLCPASYQFATRAEKVSYRKFAYGYVGPLRVDYRHLNVSIGHFGPSIHLCGGNARGVISAKPGQFADIRH